MTRTRRLLAVAITVLTAAGLIAGAHWASDSTGALIGAVLVGLVTVLLIWDEGSE